MARRGRVFRVVVAGAGPVGLLFAERLRRLAGDAGIEIRVIDASRPAAWTEDRVDARVYALSRESQWLFGELWPVIVSRRISPYRRMRVFAGASAEGPAAIGFDAAEIGEPDLGHIVEDSLLRSALIETLERAGVELSFGQGVDALEHRHGGVELTLGGGETARADLVVGADGGDSRIREAAGIEMVGRDYAQRAIVAHVVTEKAHAETAWQRFLPEGPLAFLPLADGRSSIVWTNAEAGAARLLELGDEAFLAELEIASAGILGRLGPASERLAFPLRLRHATRYTRPGVVLIGDAAHSVHPLAGQGMNLGLRDAAVLAGTLSSALAAGEYPADEFVLRRYARRQTAHNLGMQLAFDGLNELFGRHAPAWVAPLRRFGLDALDRLGPAKRFLMRRAMGLDGAIGGEFRGHGAPNP